MSDSASGLFARPFAPTPTYLTGSPLDRADAMRRDRQAIWAARMNPSARWLAFDDLKVVLADDDTLGWVRRVDVEDEATEVFLGLIEGAPRFAVAQSCGDLDGRPRDARGAFATLPSADAAIVAQARSMLDWHQRHGFCARCGAPTDMVKAGYARDCQACGGEHFPRVDPVVIMLAVTEDACLLGRQAQFPKGFMSALAGFVEPGESIEEAVRRELEEESGIEVDRVAYVSSQPWPFPSSLMIGAIAEARTTDIRLDDDELEAADWFTKADVRAALAGDGPFLMPPPMAIAHTLLATWIAS
ncbi:MAG: NAD(+) diphosphatase [Pseudomonadota bacterium]